ncbi:MAG: transposase [Bacteroidota bacterium]
MPGWDYSRGGKYYVTICTRNRICFFGDVVNDEMQLNETGKIVNDLWLKIPEHFDDTYLDEFVVMPNHIHGIVVMKRSHLINDGIVSNRDVETPNLGVSTYQMNETYQTGKPYLPQQKTMITNWAPGSLGVIINQFKRICTITIRNVKTLNLGVFTCRDFGWQPRFYDEIIRNDKRMEQIRTYIKNNPANWDKDDKNPKNIKR